MWDIPQAPIPEMFILWVEGEKAKKDVAIHSVHVRHVIRKGGGQGQRRDSLTQPALTHLPAPLPASLEEMGQASLQGLPPLPNFLDNEPETETKTG